MPTINQLIRNPRRTPKAKSKVKDLDACPQKRTTARLVGLTVRAYHLGP